MSEHQKNKPRDLWIAGPLKTENFEADAREKKPIPQPKAKRTLSRDAQVLLVMKVRRCRPVNTFKLRRMGMALPAARVQYLEAMGCVIDSVRIVAVDSDGFSHFGVDFYSLVSEPKVLVGLETLS